MKRLSQISRNELTDLVGTEMHIADSLDELSDTLGHQLFSHFEELNSLYISFTELDGISQQFETSVDYVEEVYEQYVRSYSGSPSRIQTKHGRMKRYNEQPL